MIWLTLAVCIFLADLLCKEHVLKHRKCGEEKEVCHRKIILRHVRNYGFAMNKLDSHPAWVRKICAAVSALAAVIFTRILVRPGRKLEKVGLACIIGGGANNLYDRLHRGYVLDYVSFKSPWKKFSQTVFNISDFFILGGSILYSIGYIFRKK
jgi:signal peptidase II